MTKRTETYLHGSSREEQQRLVLMNRILNERCLAAIGVAPGERVLEMGAGTGIFARALAEAVGPTGSVVAVERDPGQLATARRDCAGVARLEIRAGDAYAPPLAAGEQGAFDLVHARFLLEHLQRPADAVAAMLRAARPGGRIVLIDDDHSLMRFEPLSRAETGRDGLEAIPELWDAYTEQYARLGCDAWIGRKLVTLLHAAGARPERTTQVNYGACAGEPLFRPIADNLVAVVAGARDAMVAAGTITAERFERDLATFREWSQRADAAIWYALPLVVATRP